MNAIQLQDVLCVYVGKPGCACGCRGKYFYTKQNQELGTKDRGYEVGNDEVNDQKIQRILKKIQKVNPAELEDFGDGVEYQMSPTTVYRVYRVKK